MEENFENMFEDYMNFDEIEKGDEDLYNIEDTPNTQKRFTFDKSVCIGIDEFVRNYLFRGTNEKLDAHNLYHSSLKKLTNGTLIGISNEFAYQNPKYIQSGYLVVVLDGRKNPGTYINPIVLEQYLTAVETKKIINRKWHKKSIINDINKIRKAYIELNRALYIYSLHRDLIDSLDKLIEETNTKKKVNQLKKIPR